MIKEQNTRAKACNHLQTAALQFCTPNQIAEIRGFGAGHINDTFLVSTAASFSECFILQRINGRVFSRPESIMQNIRVLTEHISERLALNPVPGRRWEMPRILPTTDSREYWIDSDGHFWRAISFIEDAESFNSVISLEHAYEVGYAMGIFHTLVSDLPLERLTDTLEGFHITPLYVSRYEAVSKKGNISTSVDTAYCMNFIDKRKKFATVLENAKADEKLPLRVTHGDPKVSNVMIDTKTGLAVSVVDLDTVKPGIINYDIGDSLRSSCNPLGEDPSNPEEVRFESDLCRALLMGYFSAADNLLTENEISIIYDSVRLLAFELGVRFFTDFLEGNIYFKVKDRSQNLRRALVQFKLAESIESQAETLCAMIGEVKSAGKKRPI